MDTEKEIDKGKNMDQTNGSKYFEAKQMEVNILSLDSL
jgi:hypothetical protein